MGGRGGAGVGGFSFFLCQKAKQSCGWMFDVSLKEFISTIDSDADWIALTQIQYARVCCITSVVSSNPGKRWLNSEDGFHCVMCTTSISMFSGFGSRGHLVETPGTELLVFNFVFNLPRPFPIWKLT